MERSSVRYRLYFLDKRGSILLRKDFEASDDDQAFGIAILAARICSLTCSGFALWQGKRQVWEGLIDSYPDKTGDSGVARIPRGSDVPGV
jgi:hypothetical protein